MIVDVHSHTWRYPEHFTDDFREQAKKARQGQRAPKKRRGRKRRRQTGLSSEDESADSAGE